MTTQQIGVSEEEMAILVEALHLYIQKGFERARLSKDKHTPTDIIIADKMKDAIKQILYKDEDYD